MNKNGTFTLLNKTRDTFDRVYNSDKSKSIEISKGIIQGGHHFKTTITTSLLGIPLSQETSGKSSYYFTQGENSVKDLSRLNKFISNNVNVEFSFSKFETNNNKYAALSTDYNKKSVSTGNNVIDFMMKDPNMRMTYNSHNHPGGEGYAYPSGFKQSSNNYDFIPDLSNPNGDRANFEYLKATYGDRIPNTFRISVGGTNQTVIYNDKTTKVVTPTLIIE
ncbi:hypothetical protein KRE48_18045 [Elizabethkingia meningoseptica]|nr:JAB-like toxin 1 domain-containing protein [Elizabethkingia meningoseptica]MCL1674232.1 hypothetical protein [Elizabethkingia meningoseptica]MCL1685127.1 hypothetical protein [Elizabethkingia meningoseptica]MDE5494226.1 hypothetical protein [Elizabethkingia meningoseptica]